MLSDGEERGYDFLDEHVASKWRGLFLHALRKVRDRASCYILAVSIRALIMSEVSKYHNKYSSQISHMPGSCLCDQLNYIVDYSLWILWMYSNQHKLFFTLICKVRLVFKNSCGFLLKVSILISDVTSQVMSNKFPTQVAFCIIHQ